MLERTQRVADFARALGFQAVGVARADLPLEQDYERYERFLARGLQGELDWLVDGPTQARRRLDGDSILPGARSVICVGLRYGRGAPDEADPPLTQGIARYARGQDDFRGRY